ncbi:permease prefix domain 1-containing protein [Marinilactibacillus sp. GCM10026970]|uniref:permease prefix domain 1-containing protein n=1 Tax=Marinilactibacillus sp. GCM10026970 TaxID=3252642 RepID=UPI00360A9C5A
MNTIKEYVDKMFKHVVKTQETEQLKVDILANMEDRYIALKEEGASENEAIGTVIVEFGNIEEVLDEMGLNHESTSDAIMEEVMIVEEDDAHEYIETRRRAGLGIGLGVLSCCTSLGGLLGLISIFSFEPFGVFIGLTWALIFAVIGVAMFIIQGQKLSSYEDFNHPFILVPEARTVIKERMEAYRKSFTFSIILGIAICVFSFLPVIFAAMTEEDKLIVFSSGLMFTLAGVGVLVFVYTGLVWTGYQNLLNKGKSVEEVTEARIKDQRNTKITNILENIYWPILLVIYFSWSYFSGSWAWSWIIFPIGGILQSTIESIFGIED